MTGPFLLVLVALTSGAAYFVGTRRLELPGSGLRRAAGRMFEGIGISLLFFVSNVLIGMLAAFLGRLFFQRFISLYLTDDAVLPVLSLFQGLVFQWWRRQSFQ